MVRTGNFPKPSRTRFGLKQRPQGRLSRRKHERQTPTAVRRTTHQDRILHGRKGRKMSPAAHYASEVIRKLESGDASFLQKLPKDRYRENPYKKWVDAHGENLIAIGLHSCNNGTSAVAFLKNDDGWTVLGWGPTKSFLV